MDLVGKKLLILGGTKLSCEIIKQAKRQGVIVYVTDYLEDSPGKEIADKSFLISVSDIEAVIQLIKKEKIEGVLTGFVDSILPFYQKICEDSGLPCYASDRQFEIATNKIRFKSLCNAFGVPVVDEYTLKYPLVREEIENLNYPVLVKPADNSGARGIYVCENADMLISRYEDARSFSKSKKIIVERYMNEKEASIFYVIQDGNVYLSGMADRHMKNKKFGHIPLPVAYTWPSQALKNYQETVHPNIVKMFKAMGLKNGLVFIQSFVVDGKCILYEMGYRLSGSLEYKIMKKLNGLDPLEMLINFALTGSMYEESLDQKFKPNYENWGFNLTFLVKPGIIGRMEGLEAVIDMTDVLDVVTAYSPGDVIPENAIGTLKQVVLRVFGTSKTKREMITLIDRIHKAISVYSEDGEDMLLEVLNIDALS